MLIQQSLPTDGYMQFIKIYRDEIGIPLGGSRVKNEKNECNGSKVNKTCEVVLSVNKTDHRLSLPWRASLSSFKIGIPILSYGCILRYEDKDIKIPYYLCLKREYSTAYIELIRGTYKDSNLYFLLQALPDVERNLLLDNYDNFDYLWTSHCGKAPDGQPYMHAREKYDIIGSKIPLFFKHVPHIDAEGKDLWIWPKGRIDYKYSDENGVKTISVDSSIDELLISESLSRNNKVSSQSALERADVLTSNCQRRQDLIVDSQAKSTENIEINSNKLGSSYLPQLTDENIKIEQKGKNNGVTQNINIGSPSVNLGLLTPESPFECALREFNEETHGCKVEESWSICEDPICEYYLGTNSKNYCTKYFIFQSPTMFDLPKDDHGKEIIKWLSLTEISNKYISRRVAIINEIESNIVNNEKIGVISPYWKQPIDPSDYLFDFSEK